MSEHDKFVIWRKAKYLKYACVTALKNRPKWTWAQYSAEAIRLVYEEDDIIVDSDIKVWNITNHQSLTKWFCQFCKNGENFVNPH